MAHIIEVHSQGAPQRKTLAGLTLAIVPLLVAGSAIVGGGFLMSAPESEDLAVDVAPTLPVAEPAYTVVQATGTLDDADVAAYTPTITVEFAPEPEPEAAAQAPASGSQNASGSSSGGSNSGGSTAPKADNNKSSSNSSGSQSAPQKDEGTKSSKSAPAPDFQSFCPTGANASIGGSSAQGMLSAINTERARLGIGSLSWSSSLASSAQSWSNSMASKDDESPDNLGNALSHNSNRPSGGENVGVTYSSKGRSASQAMSIVHSNFMLSNSHCENLMNPKWSTVGAGLAQTDTGVWYITQNFQ